MKSMLKFLAIALLATALRADILRLRDGRMVTGNFLGATRTEIWFQNDAPGDFLGARAYPVEQVESLTFGPAAKQSNADKTGDKSDGEARDRSQPTPRHKAPPVTAEPR